MARRLFVVPRWAGTSSSDYYPWLVQELKTAAPHLQVQVLDMPQPNQPTIANWVGHLKATLPPLDSGDYLMGHSVGAQTVLRYLADTEAKIGGVLFVGAWFTVDKPWDSLMPWIETPINFDAVKRSTDNFRVLISDNDPFTSKFEENAALWRERVGAEVVVEPGQKHFNGSSEPAVLRELKLLMKL